MLSGCFHLVECWLDASVIAFRDLLKQPVQHQLLLLVELRAASDHIADLAKHFIHIFLVLSTGWFSFLDFLWDASCQLCGLTTDQPTEHLLCPRKPAGIVDRFHTFDLLYNIG